MRPIAPCKDCKDRCPEPNCHITCERYIKWLKADRKARDEEAAEKAKYRDLYYGRLTSYL